MGKVSREYPDHVGDLAEHHPGLAREVAAFTGVSSILAWMQQRGLTRTAIDMIAQDEFEYDFLIQLAPQGDWVSFGVT
jgi:hypothetical protein